jgi:hypothetical protein
MAFFMSIKHRKIIIGDHSRQVIDFGSLKVNVTGRKS